MLRLARSRIPVTAGPRLLEFAGPQRVEVLLLASNASAVIVRKTGAIAAVELANFGDDSGVPPKTGNPQSTSTRRESDTNPPNVWTFKKVRSSVEYGHAGQH